MCTKYVFDAFFLAPYILCKGLLDGRCSRAHLPSLPPLCKGGVERHRGGRDDVGVSDTAKFRGVKETGPSETPSETIERVESLLRWLCEVCPLMSVIIDDSFSVWGHDTRRADLCKTTWSRYS